MAVAAFVKFLGVETVVRLLVSLARGGVMSSISWIQAVRCFFRRLLVVILLVVIVGSMYVAVELSFRFLGQR